jgi:hypothetical protein
MITGVYLLSSFIIRPEGETYEYKDIWISFPYALMLGLILPKWIRRDRQSQAIGDALLAFSVMLSLVGYYALNKVGVDDYVFVRGSELVREGSAESQRYLRIFGMSNQIINIIYYTCFSIAFLPLLLISPRWRTNTAIVLGALVAVTCNVRTVTRTVFAIAPAVLIVVIIALYFNNRSARKNLLIRTMVLLAIGIVGYLVLSERSGGVYSIIERFRDSDRDVRIEIWGEALDILPQFPLGNGLQRMSSHLWAHNLFLDVGLTSGWGAMLALMLLTTMSLAQWRKLVVGRTLDATTTVLLSITLCLLMIAMLMPPNLSVFVWLVASVVFGRELLQLPRETREQIGRPTVISSPALARGL